MSYCTTKVLNIESHECDMNENICKLLGYNILQRKESMTSYPRKKHFILQVVCNGQSGKFKI